MNFAHWGLLRQDRRRQQVRHWMQKLGIRGRRPDQAVTTLSGGNQQKVAMARLLHWDADILLLDEPTRGIDIASKASIYQLIGELAAQGKAILFVSSYLPELIGVDDISKAWQGDDPVVEPDELPLFWACGVTPQSVVRAARPPICITHTPACMLVTDVRNASLALG